MDSINSDFIQDTPVLKDKTLNPQTQEYTNSQIENSIKTEFDYGFIQETEEEEEENEYLIRLSKKKSPSQNTANSQSTQKSNDENQEFNSKNNMIDNSINYHIKNDLTSHYDENSCAMENNIQQLNSKESELTNDLSDGQNNNQNIQNQRGQSKEQKKKKNFVSPMKEEKEIEQQPFNKQSDQKINQESSQQGIKNNNAQTDLTKLQSKAICFTSVQSEKEIAIEIYSNYKQQKQQHNDEKCDDKQKKKTSQFQGQIQNLLAEDNIQQQKSVKEQNFLQETAQLMQLDEQEITTNNSFYFHLLSHFKKILDLCKVQIDFQMSLQDNFLVFKDNMDTIRSNLIDFGNLFSSLIRKNEQKIDQQKMKIELLESKLELKQLKNKLQQPEPLTKTITKEVKKCKRCKNMQDIRIQNENFKKEIAQYAEEIKKLEDLKLNNKNQETQTCFSLVKELIDQRYKELSNKKNGQKTYQNALIQESPNGMSEEKYASYKKQSDNKSVISIQNDNSDRLIKEEKKWDHEINSKLNPQKLQFEKEIVIDANDSQHETSQNICDSNQISEKQPEIARQIKLFDNPIQYQLNPIVAKIEDSPQESEIPYREYSNSESIENSNQQQKSPHVNFENQIKMEYQQMMQNQQRDQEPYNLQSGSTQKMGFTSNSENNSAFSSKFSATFPSDGKQSVGGGFNFALQQVIIPIFYEILKGQQEDIVYNIYQFMLKFYDEQCSQGNDSLFLADLYKEYAILEKNKQQFDLSIQSYLKSKNIYESQKGPMDLGNMYFIMQDLDNALEYYYKSKNQKEQFSEVENNEEDLSDWSIDPLKLSNTHLNLGDVYYFKENYTEARKQYVECLYLRQQIFQKNDTCIVQARSKIVDLDIEIEYKYRQEQQQNTSLSDNKSTCSSEKSWHNSYIGKGSYGQQQQPYNKSYKQYGVKDHANMKYNGYNQKFSNQLKKKHLGKQYISHQQYSNQSKKAYQIQQFNCESQYQEYQQVKSSKMKLYDNFTNQK